MTDEELREKIPFFMFFMPVPAPYVRPYQAPPEGAPNGLDAIRQLNGQPSVAVANFSRDIAPGTSIPSLTTHAVSVIGASVSVLGATAKLFPALLKTPAPKDAAV